MGFGETLEEWAKNGETSMINFAFKTFSKDISLCDVYRGIIGACSSGNLTLLEFFLFSGNGKSENRNHLVIGSLNANFVCHCMEKAIENDHKIIANYLFETYLKDEHEITHHIVNKAALEGKIKLIQVLLENGADKNSLMRINTQSVPKHIGKYIKSLRKKHQEEIKEAETLAALKKRVVYFYDF